MACFLVLRGNFSGHARGRRNQGTTGQDTIVKKHHKLRFYKNGTVICQSVGGYDPSSVSKWFHTEEEGKYERRGEYKLKGKNLLFKVSNDGTPDKNLEGARVDFYEGEFVDGNSLKLKLTYASGKEVESIYSFVAFEPQ